MRDTLYRTAITRCLVATLATAIISGAHAAAVMHSWATHAPYETASLKRFPGAPNASSRLVEARQDHGASFGALHRNAEELYKATSRDAETFEAALLIPEIRLKLERALHQKLSDQMLHRLANQAKSEALYWYKYMQGLEMRGTASASDE